MHVTSILGEEHTLRRQIVFCRKMAVICLGIAGIRLEKNREDFMDYQLHKVKDLSLKKGKNGILKVIFGRTGILIACLLIQLLMLGFAFQFLAQYVYLFFGGYLLFGFLVLIVIINRMHNPIFQLSWAALVLLFPVFGGLLYLYVELQPGTRVLSARIAEIDRLTEKQLTQEEAVMQHLVSRNRRTAQLARYILNTDHYPIYENTEVKYFPSGEAKFEELKTRLRSAEKFIFLEYFIISEGHMWGSVEEILAAKVKEGVEVRLIFDGMNELYNLPHHFCDRMKELGIQCKVFSPVYPIVSTHYNNRDHRKIVVIDGKTAFTGGVNLADEYINQKQRFGHWKDAAIMVQGDAVKSFTVMFLKMWDITEKLEDMSIYLQIEEDSFAEKNNFAGKNNSSDRDSSAERNSSGHQNYSENQDYFSDKRGFVMPYAANPFAKERTAERIYIDILNSAEHYVHIMTPYLVPGHEMMQALIYAARRGIDVKIMLPHIPDKKYAFALAHSYYKRLTEAGVRIYEYTPGFVHSKVFVSDNIRAVVGAINLDYRSLYLNFECAAFLYDVPEIQEIDDDFRNTLPKCQLITPFDIRHDKWTRKVAGKFLKLFAPLM